MEENQKKSGRHYAWTILLVCCCLNASALGLTNTNGIFYAAICEDLGMMMSELTVHTIVCGLVSVVTLLFVDKIFRKYPIRPVLIGSLLMYHLSYMSMAFFSKSIEWCIASVFTGISGAFLLYVPVPLLLNNWFVKKKKLALSICFVASGFSGIVTNLLLGVIVTRFGWRDAYIFRGILLLVMSLPVMFLVKKTPQEMGLSAYGALDTEPEEEKHAQKLMGESAEKHTFEERRIKYIFAIYLAITFNLGCAMVTQLPNYANSLGLGLLLGSYLTSIAMAGNIISKAAMGPAVEKKGILGSGAVIAGLIAFGFFVIAAGFQSTPVIMAVAFTTGITACSNTLIIPNLLDTFVTGDNYVHMLSRCSMGTMLAGAFSAVLSSALYDGFGDYRPVFLVYGILETVNIIVLLTVFRTKSRKKPA